MRRYILRRLVQAVPVLFVVSVVVFLVMRLSPGDPAAQMYGAQPGVTRETIEAARREMGLDQPLVQQYLSWLGNFLRGDMGRSYINHLPVNAIIAQKLPASLQLAASALLIALLIAIPSGVVAAVKRGTRVDALLSALMAMGIAIPGFWLGILMVLVFAVWLGWLPPSGHAPLTQNPGQNLRFLVLPATTMAILLAAPIMRFLRSSMLDVLGEDYIRTARAKGLAGAGVVLRHALRNAIMPTITVVGLQFAGLIGGAIMVEWVFGWPGVGWLVVNAIFSRDYMLVQSTLMVVAATFVLVNLLVDVLYAVIDPRVRYS
jgi:peptide/nickel transport system permease protein